MSGTGSQLVELIENQGLLDAAVVAMLWRQLARNPGITAQQVVKFLVEKGHLTQFQAQKLLTSVESGATATPPKEAKPAATPVVKKKPIVDDELELAPIDGEAPAASPPPASKPTPPPAAKPAPKPAATQPAAAKPATKPTPSKPAPKTAAPADSAPLADGSELVPLEEPEMLSSADLLTPLDESAVVDAGALLTPLPDMLADPLASDPLSTAGTSGGALLSPPRRQRGWWDAGEGKSKRPKNPWESPLVIGGVGSLLVLILVGVVVFFAISRESADDLLQSAEELYQQQSYTQAIEKYNHFQSSFPKHANASLAKVRVGMARLRGVVEGARDWSQALATAREVLPTIENEPKFEVARDELTTLLPDIAAGFAAQARGELGNAEAQRKSVALADEAMELVNNATYLPATQRRSQETRLQSIVDDVNAVRREISRDEELKKTVDAIAAAAEGQVQQAFVLRKALLKNYPALEKHADLALAMSAVATKLRAQVQPAELAASPVTDDAANTAGDRLVFAAQRGSPIAGLEAQRLFVTVHGAAYGLEASTGKLLWRRGLGVQSWRQPALTSAQPGADPLLVDDREQALLRVDANTGALKWKLPLGEPCSEPVAYRNALLLTTASGALMQVDAATGTIARAIKTPQPLSGAPAFDQQRPYIYALGEHDSVYVLAADSLACEEVYFLGHAAESVMVRPILLLGHLLVLENAGLDYSLLHTLATNAEGRELRAAQPAIRLPGRVVTAPALLERGLAVTTDRGSIHVFTLEPGAATSPLRQTAQAPATLPEPTPSYALFEAGQLWVGDVRLARFDVQLALGKLQRTVSRHEGDVLLAPLQKKGAALFAVRQLAGSAGASVAALKADGADASAVGNLLWETRLGMPPAGPPLAAGDAVAAVLGDGSVFVAPAQLRGTTIVSALAVAPAGKPRLWENPVALPGGKTAYADRAQPKRQWVVDAAQPTSSVLLELKGNDPPLPGELAAFAGGLLSPQATGLIEWFDPATGAAKGLPLMPSVEAGVASKWRRPLVLGEKGNQFVIADERGQLLLATAVSQPKTMLQLVASASFAAELAAEPVAVPSRVWLTVREGTAFRLLPYSLPDLKPGEAVALPEAVAWGPHVVGGALLVGFDSGKLACYEGDGVLRWLSETTVGQLIGEPLVAGGGCLVASRDGRVTGLDLATGKIKASGHAGEALVTGPARLGGRVAAFTADGVLTCVKMDATP